MAEFNEVIWQWGRMCNDFTARDQCIECPLAVSPVCGDMEHMTKQDIEKAEKAIMEWASENPELVYPTWAEWLEQFGLVKDVIDGRCGNFLYNNAAQPIPADIAESLGIEPKEG